MIPCPGCHKTFKTLVTHQKTCAALHQSLRDGPALKRKHAEDQAVENAKRRREEEHREVVEAARERAAAEERARIQVCYHASQFLSLCDYFYSTSERCTLL